MELIKLGGPVVLVLIALSIVGLTIAFYKVLQYQKYSRSRLKKVEKALDYWTDGEAEPALAALKNDRSPFAGMLANGISWLTEKPDSEPKIREELTRQGQQIVTRVNSFNSFVELIAYLSPMLGLLGTVLGMIDVFSGLANEGGGADTGMLAGGIWEALLTTAVGLTIAIPFAIIHALLESRATNIRRAMEDQLTRLFTARLSASD